MNDNYRHDGFQIFSNKLQLNEDMENELVYDEE